MKKPWNISDDGIAAIEYFEGYRATAYRDEAGKWTIGIGHLIRPDELAPLLTAHWSHDQAIAQLHLDLEHVQHCINASVMVDLMQSQYDALCSFVFNEGCHAFETSTLLRMLNDDNPNAVYEFERWVFYTKPDGTKAESDGLYHRRELEQRIYAQGMYPSNEPTEVA